MKDIHPVWKVSQEVSMEVSPCVLYIIMNNADIWEVSSYWLPGYGNCSSIDFASTLKDTCA